MSIFKEMNNLQKKVTDNLGYRFFGCTLSFLDNPKFKFIKSNTPQEFLDREIHDFGCGDGQASLKLRKIFKARKIVGYEKNPYLVSRARKKLEVRRFDICKEELPQGEMATMTGIPVSSVV